MPFLFLLFNFDLNGLQAFCVLQFFQMISQCLLISSIIMVLLFHLKLSFCNSSSRFFLIFIHIVLIHLSKIIIFMRQANKIKENPFSNLNTSVNSINSMIGKQQKIKQKVFFSQSKKRMTSEGNNSSISESSPALNRIKLKNSFYDDHKKDYLSKSLLLSQNLINFKAKNISFSERKRYESGKTQSIIKKRDETKKLLQKERSLTQRQNKSILQNPQITYNKRTELKKRFNSLVINKFNKLFYEDKQIKVKKRLLAEQIQRNIDFKNQGRKWSSPFLNQNTMREKYEGKKLISPKIEQIYGNSNPNQLKVMNLDRLFRKKNGSLTNVIPIPFVKMSEVTSRQNIIKAIKSKDKIHDVIDQYNKLIKIMKLSKTMPKIGIKGKRFTKGPTIQELMGIKMMPTVNTFPKSDQEISEEIFIQYCTFFKNTIKTDEHLRKRVVSGIKQTEKTIKLSALTRFYIIFVNRLATLNEKIQFLLYFFVPLGQDKIQYEKLTIILQIMCMELPRIDKLNVKSDLLTKEQKSLIFMEALNRVLFSQIKQKNHKQYLSRQKLKNILENNIEATDLLIKLVQTQ